MRRTVVALALLAASRASLGAQAVAPPAPPSLVAQVAPDFSIMSITKTGIEPKKFTLSEHRGETVVLAFFPKARTKG